MNKHQPILEKYAAETQKFFESLPINEIERLNKKTFDSSDAEYKQFKSFLEKSFCYICGEKIDGFILDKPCMHWLLRPTGFDKKHFPLVFKKFNFLRIESFLRWIATTEILAGNINDLKEETNPSKLFEHTIKYKNFDWSFSCSKSDLAGHKFSFSGRAPHCHFQMRINGCPFIDYSNFHIPFTKEDLFHLPIILGMVDKAKYAYTHGSGMQEIMDIEPETLLNSMEKANDEENGVYGVQTLVEAEPGKKLSGDEIADLFKKSKKMNVPVAKLIKQMKNIGKAITFISPGPRVPEQAGRKGGKTK